MKLEGEHRFPVGREALFAALLDPALLARVLPGCEPLEATGANAFRAAMTVAVGPVKGRYQGTLALADLVPPSGYRMKLDGSGPSGFLRGEGAIALEAVDGGTRLRYALDAQVGGRIASVGQRLVESSARALAKQGLEGLERELAARAEAAAAGAAAEAAGGESPPRLPNAPPSMTAFGARFVLGLWRELPASWRWAAGALVLGALLLLAALLAGRGG